jgi:phosphate-selective porin OprO and OprP
MKPYFYLILLLLLVNQPLLAQFSPQAPLLYPRPSTGNGYVAPDSSFSVIFRFRMQNRAAFQSVSGTSLQPETVEARVRRLRLRAEGFMYSPKLTYSIQLSFSRGDMDWSVRQNSGVNESPNVVRDAAIYYKPNRHLQFIFGQTKLPGNRQRVVSSGELQFIDRSIVNAVYNIDRDFGLQAYYLNNLGRLHYMLKGAISTGDGRNISITNANMAYTGRIELLPLGLFTNFGDYFEGDLEREKTVKLSLAGGLSHNAQARRAGGQIGQDLFETRDIRTYFFDGLLKYRGFALYAEHMQRDSPNPFTLSPLGESRYIITGMGSLVQSSYLFANDVEIAARYASITPDGRLINQELPEHTYTAGLTRYLRRHRLKVQANISYHYLPGLGVPLPTPAAATRDFWYGAFQVELGI